MADRAEQVSTTGLMDTKQQAGPTKRRQYSEAVKRQIVAETRAPGASVSVVARRHDVNANQVFKWRRQYEAAVAGDEIRLVPVQPSPWPAAPAAAAAGVIEIELLSGARVRVSGA